MSSHNTDNLNCKIVDGRTILEDLFSIFHNIINGTTAVSYKYDDKSLQFQISAGAKSEPTLLLVYNRDCTVADTFSYEDQGEKSFDNCDSPSPTFLEDVECILSINTDVGNCFRTPITGITRMPTTIQRSNPTVVSQVISTDIARVEMKNVKSVENNIENRPSQTDKQENSPALSKTKQVFPCRFCKKIFFTKTNVVVHERTHTGERPYDCDKCTKTFSHKSNRDRHQRLHSLANKACSHCDDYDRLCGFQNTGNTKANSGGEKQFQCRHCDRVFLSLKSKNAHERCHYRRKSGCCSYCDKLLLEKEAKKTQTNQLKLND